ncbi:hypothetical protein HWV23_12135 [Natronomonas halophila]|uniref:DUF7518 family protein n=1 Tax=Natronomonas halophila TaxID=2747817 RepID=UPI0015B6416B|nr:hypothetical protein [Natronomonas halophila]QLD86443.1 hypothetical protein HWV23_12135 [Natronomonas halophila]
MSGNRVEELEAKVRELEATIDGLTDELVETKERLQVLEEGSDVDTDVLTRGTSSAQSTTTEQATEATDEEVEASADEVNTDEDDGEDNTDSESGDDIIVA